MKLKLKVIEWKYEAEEGNTMAVVLLLKASNDFWQWQLKMKQSTGINVCENDDSNESNEKKKKNIVKYGNIVILWKAESLCSESSKKICGGNVVKKLQYESVISMKTNQRRSEING